ncbi:MAG: autotransporter outer membrane beta-barrel domain-containing protein, partial [Opitutus sp.]
MLNEQGFATAAARQAALDRRLAALRSAPAATKGFTVFAEAGQLQNKFAAVEGLPAVAMRSSGGLAGGLWREGRWIVGATIANDRTRADLDDFGGHARIKTTTPGLFAQYDAGRFFVQGAASLGNDKYTLLRGNGLFARPSLLSAAVSGTRTDLSLTAGTTYTGKAGDWSLTPYAGILSSQVRLDDFAETRVSGIMTTGLAFKNWSVSSLRTRAGFDLARTGRRVTPRVSVVWLHELEKDRHFDAGLVGAGGAMYRAPGRPAETDIIQA